MDYTMAVNTTEIEKNLRPIWKYSFKEVLRLSGYQLGVDASASLSLMRVLQEELFCWVLFKAISRMTKTEKKRGTYLVTKYYGVIEAFPTIKLLISLHRGGTSLRTIMMLHTTPIPPVAVHEVVKTKPEVDVVTEEPAVRTRQPASEHSILHDLQGLNRLLVTKRLRGRNLLPQYLRGKKNRYFIKTPDQTALYTVVEENNWWLGYICYAYRPLQLRVMNQNGAEVMLIHRPWAYTSRCLPCQLQRMQVYSKGEFLGSVEQQWTVIKPIYLVKNSNGDNLFRIRGPICTSTCFSDERFKIQRYDGTPIGSCVKNWQGLVHSLFLSHVFDNFDVTFEQSLSVEEKALLLAAALLMDYMYFDG